MITIKQNYGEGLSLLSAMAFFLIFLGCGKNPVVSSISTTDTVTCQINDTINLVSIYDKGKPSIEYLTNKGKLDGQYIKYDTNGRVIKRTYYSNNYYLASENFFYNDTKLDSSCYSVIGESEDEKVIATATYNDDKIINVNPCYYGFNKYDYVINRGDTVLFQTYGLLRAAVVFGEFDENTFEPYSDTIFFQPEKNIGFGCAGKGLNRNSGIFLFMEDIGDYLVIKLRIYFSHYNFCL